MKILRFFLVCASMSLATCKDKPTPTWTVRVTNTGKSCYATDSKYTYVYGTGKLDCYEYKSKDSGPASVHDYTRCYLDLTNHPIVQKSVLEKLETCEVSFEGLAYVFSDLTGGGATMTQGETKTELVCNNTSDVSEYNDLDSCQSYFISRYK